MITVNLVEIPEEGLRFQGDTDTDIFAFSPTEKEVKTAGPVSYDLFLSDVGSDLILAQGTLLGRFSLRCVVCLEWFPYVLRVENYAAEFDLPEDGVLDLTERLREDLLLELPSYPHCDRDGDDPKRICPLAAHVSAEKEPEEGDSKGSSAWDALDELPDSDS